MRRWLWLFVLVWYLILVAAACSSAASTPTPTPAASATTGEGALLVEERCTVCHSLARIQSAHKTEAEWKATVDQMIRHGAQLTPEEETIVVQYLAATYK
jgi:cytochrome c5